MSKNLPDKIRLITLMSKNFVKVSALRMSDNLVVNHLLGSIQINNMSITKR